MQQLECAERCSGKSLRSREWNWLEVLPWIPVDSAWVCSSCGARRRRLLSYHTAFDWEGTNRHTLHHLACIVCIVANYIICIIYGTGLQTPLPPAMGMVPRIGCTTSLESNYHARYLCFPPPVGWVGCRCLGGDTIWRGVAGRRPGPYIPTNIVPRDVTHLRTLKITHLRT